ncbi:MAG: 6-phosphofructokinase [Ruminococcaceae bacterium]|nr:6-phosphofructokinase [Oscillospiraceae bacterium]
MNSAVKRIGVLTSGGDAPGMNAAIRAVVRTAIAFGIECVGIRRGYAGLIAGDMFPMTAKDVNGLTERGGTILYTARSKEFMTEAGQKRAADNCRYMGIDGLVTIGGDGTFRGAEALSKHGVSVVGIPATIDNDIACTTYTIGYDTACNTAIESIDKLRDTMKSHERCSVIEVMGRNAGHLALYVGIAAGATSVLIPEKEINLEKDIVDKIRKARLRGRTHFTIIVAEGAGSAQSVAEEVKNLTGIDTRVTVLGHVQRGGQPLVRDRVIATRMGYHAVEVLAAGQTNRIVTYHNDKCDDVDIDEGLAMHKGIEEEVYAILDAIMTGA